MGPYTPLGKVTGKGNVVSDHYVTQPLTESLSLRWKVAMAIRNHDGILGARAGGAWIYIYKKEPPTSSLGGQQATPKIENQEVVMHPSYLNFSGDNSASLWRT